MSRVPFRRSGDTCIPRIKGVPRRSFIANVVIRNACILEIPTSDDPVTSKSSKYYTMNILDEPSSFRRKHMGRTCKPEYIGDKLMLDSSAPVAG